jgi:hypothetical protein
MTYEIYEEKPDHHFRTEMPNIIFDIQLDPFTIAVYGHLKRVAGDNGYCWKSYKKIAESCMMSETKVKECMKILSEVNLFLNSPLVKIQERFKSDGSKDSNLITIIPIWRLNVEFFRSGGGGSPENPGVGRQKTGGGSPQSYKEEPYKKEHKEETTTTAIQTPVVVVSPSDQKEKMDILEKIPLLAKKDQICQDYSLEQIKNAYKALNSARNVRTSAGFFIEALKDDYTPIKTKEEKQQQSIEDMEKYKEQAEKLYEEFEELMTFEVNFKVFDTRIEMKESSGIFPVAFNEIGIANLKGFINHHFKG